MISPNETNIIIFDSKTGDYWRKLIEPDEGPTDWSKESVNLKKQNYIYPNTHMSPLVYC